MQAPQYLLPKVGVATNQIELRHNQQKLHQLNYDQNLPTHTPRPNPHSHLPFSRNQLSELNPFKPDEPQDNYASYLNRSLSHPHINKNIHAEIIKNSLSNELSQQIALKQQLKKYEKKQEITLEQQIVSHNKLLENKQALKEKNFKQTFKQEALRNAQLKELRKKNQKQFLQFQKQSFDHLYRKNHEIVQNRILGIEDPLPYVPKTRRVSNSELAEYAFNPEIGIVPKISMHKPNFEESSKLRENLKSTLIEQMKMNSEKKRMERQKQWSTPFIDEKFKNLDNPITNPIDIKIAKDNKYLMKELLGPKISMGKSPNGAANQKQNMRASQVGMDQSSYLSRRGSSSLSKLGFAA